MWQRKSNVLANYILQPVHSRLAGRRTNSGTSIRGPKSIWIGLSWPGVDTQALLYGDKDSDCEATTNGSSAAGTKKAEAAAIALFTIT
jgi:hypothetical protein